MSTERSFKFESKPVLPNFATQQFKPVICDLVSSLGMWLHSAGDHCDPMASASCAGAISGMVRSLVNMLICLRCKDNGAVCFRVHCFMPSMHGMDMEYLN